MEPEEPIDLDSLLHDAVAEILSREDARHLATWLRSNLLHHMGPELREATTPDVQRAMAANLARAIWNVTPLPGNRYQPAPLPWPKRNDPCLCESGRKYKQCCAALPNFPQLSVELMWTYLLDQMDDDEVARGLASKRIPITAVVDYASGLLNEDDPHSAYEVLQAIFEDQPLAALKCDAHEHALDLFSNACDDLGLEQEKVAFVERVVREAARSPLRAGAWQRLAEIRMDLGDAPGAWDAFRHAQRDQPAAPALAHLEIMLLVGEDRHAEIPDRARHWTRRLRREGFDDGDPLIDWLHDVARHPTEAIASLAIQASGGEGALLRARLPALTGRALPRYTLMDGPEPTTSPGSGDGTLDRDDAVADRLRAMGMAREQIPDIVRRLREELPRQAPGDPPAGAPMPYAPPLEPDDSRVLAAPAALRDVERAWHDVFPGEKPFSVGDAPMASLDPWETEEAWCEFLDAHPAAGDSLDVLDDLATAVMAHERGDDEDFERVMLAPLLERAYAIVHRCIEGTSAPRLAWVHPDNRVALRALVRLSMWHLRRGDAARAQVLAEEVLALNPGDNHGLRGFLINRHLADDRDADALALAQRFHDDLLAETVYGRALALFRLERRDEADHALREAVDRLPKVRDYLVRMRVSEPHDGHGTGVGVDSDEQAWVYREDMREVWARTPGAMDWLARTTRRTRRR